MKIITNIFITILAAINSFLLIAITFWSLSSAWQDDETFKTYHLFNLLFNNFIFQKADTTDAQKDKIVFINAKNCKELGILEDKNVEGYIVGNQAIMNRKKLLEFLKEFEKNPIHKAILIDELFDLKTDNDPELAKVIKKIPNIIITQWYKDEKRNFVPLAFEIEKEKTAVKDFTISEIKNDLRFTYPIFAKDSLKSVSLRLYESRNKERFKPYIPALNLYASDENIVLNYFIAHQKANTLNLTLKYPIVNLCETDTYKDDKNIFNKIFKDKIIVIGKIYEKEYDFFNQNNKTLFIINHFLALENGENTVSWSLLLVLFLFYFLISLSIFFSKHQWLAYAYTYRKKHRIQSNFLKKMYEIGIGIFIFIISYSIINLFYYFALSILFVLIVQLFNLYLDFTFIFDYLFLITQLHFLFIILSKKNQKSSTE